MLTDIENLSTQELKDQRDTLVSSIVESDTKMPELAARYVQARTDAKLRDDKLAEQSQTIANLNESLNEQKGKVRELSLEKDALQVDKDTNEQSALLREEKLKSAIEAQEQENSELKAHVAELKDAVAKANKLAKERRAALAGVTEAIGRINADVSKLLVEEG